MLSNRIARLVAPPRRVPLPLVCSALLGLTGALGAIFFFVGMTVLWMSLSSPWVLLFSSVFSIVGAAFFISATAHGLEQVRLLRWGEVASTRSVSQHGTNTYVNDEPVIEYTYEFEGRDGRVHSGSSKALRKEEIGDEAREPVLYLPSNPECSVLVDALPLRYTLDVDGAGQWVSYEGLWTIVWCCLAWAGVGVHVMYGLLRVLGVF